MDRMHAPWRAEYIRNPDKEGCIFCNAVRSDDDRKCFVLERDESTITLMNIYPYNNGHIMIAPKKHTGDLQKLNESELIELWKNVQKWQAIIKKALNPQGYNIGMNLGRIAGAGFEHHLHIHVVPRWKGDTNFMPVIGETKVIPMSVEEAYDLLLKTYNE